MPDSDTVNPLAEAQVDSLSHLMSLNPDTLTEDEKMKIILAFREQRVRWQSEEQQGVKYKTKAAKIAGDVTQKKQTKVAAPPGFSLKDLGL